MTALTAFARTLLALASMADLTALLNVFTDLLPGTVPASGGGTVNFLRADGTWVPGIVGDGDKGDVVVSASGATWTLDPTVVTAAARVLLAAASAADQRTAMAAAQSGTNTDITDLLGVTGFIGLSTTNALVATGTVRADALALTTQVNRLGTVAAGTGVVIPLTVGVPIVIFNSGVNPVRVYAPGAATIDGVAGATGVPLTNALRCIFWPVTAAIVVSSQLGVISA